MATLTVQLPDELKSLLESRAAQAGYADVSSFVAGLIAGEATGAPEGLLDVESDDQLESLLNSRMDGPFVEADAADFKQMRDRFIKRLNSARGRKS